MEAISIEMPWHHDHMPAVPALPLQMLLPSVYVAYFWPKHFRVMAPKRSNRSGGRSSNSVLPYEDGVLRNYAAVARIEDHVFDDEQSIGENVERLKCCLFIAEAWIRFISKHPHTPDLRDAILILIKDITCMVSRLKATRTTVKGEVREIVQRWLELQQIVEPRMPDHPRKRARVDDDVAPPQSVHASVWSAHSDIEPETNYGIVPSAGSENDSDASSDEHTMDEDE